MLSFTMFAQNISNTAGINKLSLEVRTDFDHYNWEGTSDQKSGFYGRYLNFNISGDISDNLFYQYRQRLNLKNLQTFNDFFDGTDYMILGWKVTDNFTLTVGKEVIAMGGIEYDLAPINVYFHTQMWDNFSCYQFGFNAQFTTRDKKNEFTIQMTNSPFGGRQISGLYNYSLHWRANYKHFGPVCSINFYEYANNKFINYIALGTSFTFGPIEGYANWTNRATTEQKNFFFDDMTIDGRIGVNMVQNKLNVYVKAGYDINKAQDYKNNIITDKIYDLCILPGTEVLFYGAGAEFYPVKDSRNIRIHTFFAVNDARSTMDLASGLLVPNPSKVTYQANVGITWRMNFINK